MRKRFFPWLGHTTYRHYFLWLFAGLLVTIILGYFAGKIRMDSTWMAILPENDPSVATFQKILDEFGDATQIIVALDGPSETRVEEVAEAVAPQLAALKKWVRRVDFKYDTSFVNQHGLLLEKVSDLKKMAPLFTDYNLVPFLRHVNDLFESEYTSSSESLTRQEKEAVQSLDGMFGFVNSLGAAVADSSAAPKIVPKAVNGLTTGSGYYLSNDKKMLLMMLTPTMSISDIQPVVEGVNAIDAKLREFGRQYPDVHFGMTGMHVVSRDEMVTGTEDTERNTGMAFLIILVVFILSFRMVTAPLIAMLVLAAGITWDIGIAQMIFGRLNIMTAFMSIILLGLGVDYAIHLISAYSEFRHKRHSIEQALVEAFSRVGMGVVMGALTTAVAFLTLTLTSFEAFREWGVVAGIGILTCLAASLFFLPAVLVLQEKIRLKFKKREELKEVNMEFRFLGKLGNSLSAHPWGSLGILILLTFFLVTQMPRVHMNSNYMNLEAKGLESVRLQNEIARRMNLSADNLMLVANSLAEADRYTEMLDTRSTVGLVESITKFLPPQSKQQKRRPWVRKIKRAQAEVPPPKPISLNSLKAELQRFQDNIDEMAQLAFMGGLDRVVAKCDRFLGLNEAGKQVSENKIQSLLRILEDSPEALNRLSRYQSLFVRFMRKRIARMANPESITMDQVPQAVKNRFVSRDGRHFLILIYTNRNLWEGLVTTNYLENVTRGIPGITGTPVFMKSLVREAARQGKQAFLFAFLAILFLLLLDFKKVGTTFLAMTPLLVSAIWLLGTMGLFHIPLTIVNVMGFPLILGIGIDDGVHIIHRYQIEGKGSLPYVLSSIGKAIFLTSLTTLLGFGSLMLSRYRGYAGLGELLAIGIGFCFVLSVTLLPTLLKLLYERRK